MVVYLTVYSTCENLHSQVDRYTKSIYWDRRTPVIWVLASHIQTKLRHYYTLCASVLVSGWLQQECRNQREDGVESQGIRAWISPRYFNSWHFFDRTRVLLELNEPDTVVLFCARVRSLCLNCGWVRCRMMLSKLNPKLLHFLHSGAAQTLYLAPSYTT